jgi:hypothetical protein
MYPAKPGLIIGFHGCDKKVRDSIVKAKSPLKASDNDYDWLGHGMYFWENNKQRALDFATNLKKNPRANKEPVKTPAVLGAVMDMGFCLDLLDSEYLELVKESYQNLVESCKTLGIDVPVNKNLPGSSDLLLRRLDCAVIENLHQQRKLNNLTPFDSVRGVFVEGEKLYPSAGFNEKNHIQICICNPNCVKGFFIPRTADNNFEVP